MYPSEQMFFNAMRRKGWSPREEDMARCELRTRSAVRCLLCVSSVVAIHNTVNERAWREVLAWEVLHHGCGQRARHSAATAFLVEHTLRCHSWCEHPRLVRFVGRPQDYSPKARLLNLLGYKLPFDRHDWVVDRCGREVRRVHTATAAAF